MDSSNTDGEQGRPASLFISSDSAPSEAKLWSADVSASLAVKCHCILISPPFSEHGNCSEMLSGRRPVRSTGDDSQALNLFKLGLSLTQGRAIVADVFFVAWVGNLIIN